MQTNLTLMEQPERFERVPAYTASAFRILKDNLFFLNKGNNLHLTIMVLQDAWEEIKQTHLLQVINDFCLLIELSNIK